MQYKTLHIYVCIILKYYKGVSVSVLLHIHHDHVVNVTILQKLCI